MQDELVELVLELYPRIYFGCHTRHEPDPETRKGLTHQQEMILGHLDDEEGTNLNWLASHMGVTPSTMSIHVDRLVKKGFVQRVQAQEDRRKVELRLTPEGSAIIASQNVLDPARVGQMLEKLTPEQRQQGVEGLRLLAEAALQIGYGYDS